MATCCGHLATLAQSDGDNIEAARLLGAAEALRELAGAALDPHEQRSLARTAAILESELGQEAFAAALMHGRSMPNETVREVLDSTAAQH